MVLDPPCARSGAWDGGRDELPVGVDSAVGLVSMAELTSRTLSRMPRPTADQLDVCRRLGVEPDPPEPDDMLGLGPMGSLPINGLRHPRVGQTSGWYVWTGAEVDRSDDEFFRPFHVGHLDDHVPSALPYLALPPGWRFQLAPGHEDIWFDPELLRVD